ncbi:hypothetical protein TanjilG_08410 [Lupinus angustifolius]|uniref:RRM domain-containing protein n=1 Tax=Lupinus angustifolius TaxID=3871 RepID=A0A1J7HS92_LUPAN|nr:hypothetical protein TanjilG_08410 [Lupinus angustifolius]
MREREKVRERVSERGASYRTVSGVSGGQKNHNSHQFTNRDEGFRYKPRGFFKSLQSSCTTFFFTNIPESHGIAEMWAVFAKWGSVGDVIIPQKRDKRGNRFGFVRFKQSDEEDKLLKALEQVWIGNYKIKINSPRFKRREDMNFGKGGQNDILGGGKKDSRMVGGNSQTVNLCETDSVVKDFCFSKKDSVHSGDGKGSANICAMEVDSVTKDIDDNAVWEKERFRKGKGSILIDLTDVGPNKVFGPSK